MKVTIKNNFVIEIKCKDIEEQDLVIDKLKALMLGD